MGVLPVEQFADIRVRQAMDLSIDRQGLVRSLYLGAATPLQSQPAQEGLPGYNPAIRAEYNVTRARQLMAEAGQAAGFRSVLRYPPQNAPMTVLAQALPGSFQQIGIDVTLEAVEQAVFLQRSVQNPNGNGPLFMALASYLVPDASWHLSFWRTPNNRGFDNPEFNPLFLQSQQELDPARRVRMLQDLSRMVADNKTFLYLLSPNANTVAFPNVRGYEQSLVGFPRYQLFAKQ